MSVLDLAPRAWTNTDVLSVLRACACVRSRSRTGSARVRRGYQGRSKNRMAARAFPRRLVRTTQPRVQRCAGAGA